MIILGENVYFNNGYKQNSNTLIVGAPGTGKSRGFVIPNLCEANNESIILLDPKGELYNITREMMEKKGYQIKVLDFDHPEQSPTSYNPLAFIKTQDDVIKFSSILVTEQKNSKADPFWPLSSQMLCNAITDYLIAFRPTEQQTLSSIQKLLAVAVPGDSSYEKSKLDVIFEALPDNAWCKSQYALVRNSADRTLKSIVISLAAEICGLLTPEIVSLTSKNDINPQSFCEKKTILYVKCSDTDRSKDKLVAIFFSQLIHELYLIADQSSIRSLPRPVHIILDDMGANLQIPNLDCLISTSRGRDISFSLILQSFGQLKKNYIDYTSIISSCNNLVFLGSNDIETCQDIATRLNKPLNDVLYKEKGTIFVFRQGEKKPFTTRTYDLTKHPLYNELSTPYTPQQSNPKNIEKGEIENYDEF